MPTDFKIQDRVLVIAHEGEIDHHETKAVREIIDRRIDEESPETVIFDFSRTTFMDSSGLGLILGRYRKAKEMGIEVEIANPGEKILKILTMAGVDRLIKVKGVIK